MKVNGSFSTSIDTNTSTAANGSMNEHTRPSTLSASKDMDTIADMADMTMEDLCELLQLEDLDPYDDDGDGDISFSTAQTSISPVVTPATTPITIDASDDEDETMEDSKVCDTARSSNDVVIEPDSQPKDETQPDGDTAAGPVDEKLERYSQVFGRHMAEVFMVFDGLDDASSQAEQTEGKEKEEGTVVPATGMEELASTTMTEYIPQASEETVAATVAASVAASEEGVSQKTSRKGKGKMRATPLPPPPPVKRNLRQRNAIQLLPFTLERENYHSLIAPRPKSKSKKSKSASSQAKKDTSTQPMEEVIEEEEEPSTQLSVYDYVVDDDEDDEDYQEDVGLVSDSEIVEDTDSDDANDSDVDDGEDTEFMTIDKHASKKTAKEREKKAAKEESKKATKRVSKKADKVNKKKHQKGKQKQQQKSTQHRSQTSETSDNDKDNEDNNEVENDEDIFAFPETLPSTPAKPLSPPKAKASSSKKTLITYKRKSSSSQVKRKEAKRRKRDTSSLTSALDKHLTSPSSSELDKNPTLSASSELDSHPVPSSPPSLTSSIYVSSMLGPFGIPFSRRLTESGDRSYISLSDDDDFSDDDDLDEDVNRLHIPKRQRHNVLDSSDEEENTNNNYDKERTTITYPDIFDIDNSYGSNISQTSESDTSSIYNYPDLLDFPDSESEKIYDNTSTTANIKPTDVFDHLDDNTSTTANIKPTDDTKDIFDYFDDILFENDGDSQKPNGRATSNDLTAYQVSAGNDDDDFERTMDVDSSANETVETNRIHTFAGESSTSQRKSRIQRPSSSSASSSASSSKALTSNAKSSNASISSTRRRRNSRQKKRYDNDDLDDFIVDDDGNARTKRRRNTTLQEIINNSAKELGKVLPHSYICLFDEALKNEQELQAARKGKRRASFVDKPQDDQENADNDSTIDDQENTDNDYTADDQENTDHDYTFDDQENAGNDYIFDDHENAGNDYTFDDQENTDDVYTVDDDDGGQGSTATEADRQQRQRTPRLRQQSSRSSGSASNRQYKRLRQRREQRPSSSGSSSSSSSIGNNNIGSIGSTEIVSSNGIRSNIGSSSSRIEIVSNSSSRNDNLDSISRSSRTSIERKRPSNARIRKPAKPSIRDVTLTADKHKEKEQQRRIARMYSLRCGAYPIPLGRSCGGKLNFLHNDQFRLLEHFDQHYHTVNIIFRQKVNPEEDYYVDSPVISKLFDAAFGHFYYLWVEEERYHAGRTGSGDDDTGGTQIIADNDNKGTEKSTENGTENDRSKNQKYPCLSSDFVNIIMNNLQEFLRYISGCITNLYQGDQRDVREMYVSARRGSFRVVNMASFLIHEMDTLMGRILYVVGWQSDVRTMEWFTKRKRHPIAMNFILLILVFTVEWSHRLAPLFKAGFHSIPPESYTRWTFDTTVPRLVWFLLTLGPSSATIIPKRDHLSIGNPLAVETWALLLHFRRQNIINDDELIFSHIKEFFGTQLMVPGELIRENVKRENMWDRHDYMWQWVMRLAVIRQFEKNQDGTMTVTDVRHYDSTQFWSITARMIKDLRVELWAIRKEKDTQAVSSRTLNILNSRQTRLYFVLHCARLVYLRYYTLLTEYQLTYAAIVGSALSVLNALQCVQVFTGDPVHPQHFYYQDTDAERKYFPYFLTNYNGKLPTALESADTCNMIFFKIIIIGISHHTNEYLSAVKSDNQGISQVETEATEKMHLEIRRKVIMLTPALTYIPCDPPVDGRRVHDLMMALPSSLDVSDTTSIVATLMKPEPFTNMAGYAMLYHAIIHALAPAGDLLQDCMDQVTRSSIDFDTETAIGDGWVTSIKAEIRRIFHVIERHNKLKLTLY